MAVFNFDDKAKKYTEKSNKTIGIILLVICSICFFALLTNIIPFLKNFLLGLFGLFSYPMFLTIALISIALINNKKYVMTKKYVIYLSIALISLLAFIQLIVVNANGLNFIEYLGLCYTKQTTAGGLIIGLITAPILYTLSNIGAYIIFSAVFVIFCALIADYLYYLKSNISLKKPINIIEVKSLPKTTVNSLEKEININKPKLGLDAKLENVEVENPAKRKLGLIETNIATNNQTIDAKPVAPVNKKEYILSGKNEFDYSKYKNFRTQSIEDIQSNIASVKKENLQTNLIIPNKVLHEDDTDFMTLNKSATYEKSYIAPIENKSIESDPEEFASSILKSLSSKEDKKSASYQPTNFRQLNIEETKPLAREIKTNDFKIEKSSLAAYIRPSIELLETESMSLESLNQDIVVKRQQLEIALETFGIPAKVIAVVVGPAVTRYELEMPAGISIKKLLTHQEDIAYNLASNGDIRIEAPIPGKSAVGIEVPNDKIATVGLKDILTSKEFMFNKSPLTFPLGKDINGNAKLCSLPKMPHLLIAGATNSGKSVCLNVILISILYKYSPDDVRILLIDPKRVEFAGYAGLPHLIIPNVINDGEKAINALGWAINEMERRYLLFEETRTRNLEEYNSTSAVVEGSIKKLPYIVIMIDEFADILMTSKKELEEKIMRLAQKARAAGIHLILATQRPSVNVVTGSIKTNFPSRISFALTSFADSKTVLDQSGAEKLLGKGDMLFMPSDAAEPKRIQGAYITSEEVNRVVEFVKEYNKEFDFDAEIDTAINNPPRIDAINLIDGDNASRTGYDSLVPAVLKYFIENGQASTSMIQRRFLVGYPRASRIIDQLQQANYISPPDGSKPRSVYITIEEYEELFGDEE